MKAIINKIVITALMYMLLPFTMQSQQRVLSLQECIDEALKNNISISLGNASIEKAQILQSSAFELEKTNVSLNQSAISGAGMDNSLNISQSFESPTLYIAKKNVLKSMTQLENASLYAKKKELIKDVTSSYYQLLYIKEKLKLLQQQDSIYSKFVFLVNTKYSCGEASQLEKMNADRLQRENILKLQTEKKSYQNLQYKLGQLLNTQDNIDVKETCLPILDLVDASFSSSIAHNPILQMYEAQKTVSEKNEKLAIQGYVPSFSVSLSTQMLIKDFNPYNVSRDKFEKGNFMGFQVGMSIPLFFGSQKAKVKAAKKDTEISTLALQSSGEELRTLLLTYRNEYLKAKTNIDYYVSEGMPRANNILRISNISYEKGEINYIEYIQNMLSVSEIKMQYASSKNDYNQAIIMLNYLTGNK